MSASSGSSRPEQTKRHIHDMHEATLYQPFMASLAGLRTLNLCKIGLPRKEEGSPQPFHFGQAGRALRFQLARHGSDQRLGHDEKGC